MNKIYDNGTIILGSIIDIKEYICKNCENFEEVKEIIEELENYDSDSIVAINYDNGMGLSYDFWTERDMIKECE